MNKDFPRILSLLRKERKLSQKQVAQDLGVAQALLSHYEKGKRECGLDFLVRAADYFDVSADYLLGRSAISSGCRINETDLPETEAIEKSRTDLSGLAVSLNKKLITNSIDLIFSLLLKMKNTALTSSVAQYLTLSVYNAFRLTYKSNPKNNDDFFGISQDYSPQITQAAMQLAEGAANKAISEGDFSDDELTTLRLEAEYQKQATALLSLIKNSENQLKKLSEIK